MRNLGWVLLLMMLCAPSAKGACLDWSQSVGRPDHSLVYAGKLGDRPIRMMLHLYTANERFDGAYGYNNQPKMLILTGSMLPGGVGVDLDERDAQGHVTGHFSLKFFRPRPAREDPVYQKYPSKCDDLTGSWQSSSGNEAHDVAVHLDGETVPADDKKRELNETTAYKLREAMLSNNRKAFASLLRYPFYQNSGRWVVGVWHNPEEVIKNYDKIIPFSHNEIRDSVPHVLQTSLDTSQFMNRSVYITHGKVTRICSGACPVIP